MSIPAALLALTVLMASDSLAAGRSGERDWMAGAGYGLFISYQIFGVEKLSPAEFDARVNTFDVDKFVVQVERTGASYLIFTLGQNSGYYCAPNDTYDRLVGTVPGEKTATRDLPLELGKALAAKRIRLVLYLPARAPQKDRAAMEALGDVPQDQPTTQHFIEHWSAVVREWSLRYGPLVSGWWIDGYLAPEGWDIPQAAYNWKTFTDSLRAGNPQAELAFNLGSKAPKRFRRANPAQTFTAGDSADLSATPRSNPAEAGLTWHAATYLGRHWGSSSEKPRFDSRTLLKYIDSINAEGGFLTLDVPTLANGTIPPIFLETLHSLAEHKEQLTNDRLDEELQK